MTKDLLEKDQQKLSNPKKREKIEEKNEQSLEDLWDNIKGLRGYLGSQKVGTERMREKKKSEEITEYIPKFGKRYNFTDSRSS